MTDLTAPMGAVDLGGMVDLVERFALADLGNLAEWTVTQRADLPGRMLVRWDRLAVTVRERGDLELARYIALERTRARQTLDRIVVERRAALGWGRGEPRVRCVVCRTSARASEQHAPGGRECADTREDRRLAHADWDTE